MSAGLHSRGLDTTLSSADASKPQAVSRSHSRRLRVAAKPVRKPARTSGHSSKPSSGHGVKIVHSSKQPAAAGHSSGPTVRRHPTAKKRPSMKALRKPQQPPHRQPSKLPHRQPSKPPTQDKTKAVSAPAKPASRAAKPASKRPSPKPVKTPAAGRSPAGSTTGETESTSKALC